MQIKVITKLTENLKIKLEEFSSNHPKGCFFSSIEYCNVIEKSPKFHSLIIIVLFNDEVKGLAIGEITNEFGWLPFISRRTIFYAEPIYTDIAALDIILKEISNKSKGIFCQIRPFFELSMQEIEIYRKNEFDKINHFNAFINVDDINQVYNAFDKDKQKGIRKAKEKFGIKIEEINDSEKAIDTFYSIQQKLFKRKRHSLKSKDYFTNLVKESSGKVRIAFAFFNGEPIASQLYLISPSRLTAFYTATLPEHRDKHAGDLLVSHLIEICSKNRIKVFDFGGGGVPDKSYAPRDYKKRFGTVFKNVGRFTLSKSIFYKLAFLTYYKFVRY